VPILTAKAKKSPNIRATDLWPTNPSPPPSPPFSTGREGWTAPERDALHSPRSVNCRWSWNHAVEHANVANKNVKKQLLFHDLRRSAARVMTQEAGLPESQAMLISGHKTRSMLERYNIVSLKNVQDAGLKLDAWSKGQTGSKAPANASPIRYQAGRYATKYATRESWGRFLWRHV